MNRTPALCLSVIALIAGTCLTGMSGCSFYVVDSEDVPHAVYPPKKDPSQVEYLPVVQRPYEIIGIVKVTTQRSQKISEVIELMKQEAARLGADAITNLSSDATGAWKKLKPRDLLGNAYINAQYKATAVVFQQ